jgi:exopolyphosphatase/pppGpp-phosphohydrolase
VVTLHIEGSETRVVSQRGHEPADTIVLAIGYAGPGHLSFRHDPPTPLELENAITEVEDEVMPLAKRLPRPSELVGSGLAMEAIAAAARPGGQGSARIALDEVERLFQQLAAVSEGRPVASGGVPSGAAFAATLLILREFMHHLGFEAITIDAFTEAGPDSAPVTARPRQENP